MTSAHGPRSRCPQDREWSSRFAAGRRRPSVSWSTLRRRSHRAGAWRFGELGSSAPAATGKPTSILSSRRGLRGAARRARQAPRRPRRCEGRSRPRATAGDRVALARALGERTAQMVQVLASARTSPARCSGERHRHRRRRPRGGARRSAGQPHPAPARRIRGTVWPTVRLTLVPSAELSFPPDRRPWSWSGSPGHSGRARARAFPTAVGERRRAQRQGGDVHERVHQVDPPALADQVPHVVQAGDGRRTAAIVPDGERAVGGRDERPVPAQRGDDVEQERGRPGADGDVGRARGAVAPPARPRRGSCGRGGLTARLISGCGRVSSGSAQRWEAAKRLANVNGIWRGSFVFGITIRSSERAGRALVHAVAGEQSCTGGLAGLEAGAEDGEALGERDHQQESAGPDRATPPATLGRAW